VAIVKLKGVNRVRDPRSGQVYFYAWRGKGAPRLDGEPGSPQFIASYVEAHASRKRPDAARIIGLVSAFRSSPDFAKLAPSTRAQWSRWLDRIADYFGELPVAQFERLDRIKPIIRRWRDTYAETPRTADYAVQVLSRLMAFAVDQGRLSTNPCEGIKRLYEADRSDIIWTDADIARVGAKASDAVMNAIRLAAASGLRRGDLFKLCWSHIEADAIVIRTGKSREKVEAMIPLYPALRDLLAALPRRSTSVLTTASGSPWTTPAWDSAWRRAKPADWPDLHFHDLRGTAVTRFYLAGLTTREIAEVMGWDEDGVTRIIRRYVGRHAATAAVIAKLKRTGSGTGAAKRAAKSSA